jgi:hypothetical protein
VTVAATGVVDWTAAVTTGFATATAADVAFTAVATIGAAVEVAGLAALCTTDVAAETGD